MMASALSSTLQTFEARDALPPAQKERSVRFEDVYNAYKEYINPPLARFMKLAGATVETEARGCRIYDENGKSYLDFCGGYGVFTLGYQHPKVVAAVRDQLEHMALSSRVFFNA
ncbi:MAG TPA: aminotransferase class III-fold pyridoxal phosphate-dependent enzyme, partial [Vicinamibacterales bacterium]